MLGENIRRIRTERHLTQSALAEKSGVSVQQINQIEWGAKGLSVPTLVRIARALESYWKLPGVSCGPTVLRNRTKKTSCYRTSGKSSGTSFGWMTRTGKNEGTVLTAISPSSKAASRLLDA